MKGRTIKYHLTQMRLAHTIEFGVDVVIKEPSSILDGLSDATIFRKHMDFSQKLRTKFVVEIKLKGRSM